MDSSKTAEADRTAPANEAGAASPLVWIVEDDALVRSALRRAVARDGFDVHTFASAADAMAAWSEKPHPAAIICDMHLRGMDGVDFLGWIRRDDSEVALILCSADLGGAAHGESDDRFAFLAKPFAPSELLAHLRSATGG